MESKRNRSTVYSEVALRAVAVCALLFIAYALSYIHRSSHEIRIIISDQIKKTRDR